MLSRASSSTETTGAYPRCRNLPVDLAGHLVQQFARAAIGSRRTTEALGTCPRTLDGRWTVRRPSPRSDDVSQMSENIGYCRVDLVRVRLD